MAIHSSILAWKIPWTEEPGGLPSMGSHCQGKLASSQIDFWYTEQFCIPGVTSVFFWSCDSVVGDSLELNQAN